MSVAAWWHSGTAETQTLSQNIINGSLNETLESATCSAAGSVKISASVNQTLEDCTLVFSGVKSLGFIIKQRSDNDIFVFSLIDSFDFNDENLVFNKEGSTLMNKKPGKLAG